MIPMKIMNLRNKTYDVTLTGYSRVDTVVAQSLTSSAHYGSAGFEKVPNGWEAVQFGTSVINLIDWQNNKLRLWQIKIIAMNKYYRNIDSSLSGRPTSKCLYDCPSGCLPVSTFAHHGKNFAPQDVCPSTKRILPIETLKILEVRKGKNIIYNCAMILF